MKRGYEILIILILIAFPLISAFQVGIDYPEINLPLGYNVESCVTAGCFDDFITYDINSNSKPLLLVHGWTNVDDSDKTDWGAVPSYLRNKGYDVYTLKLNPANLSNKKNAGAIGRSIDNILDSGYRPHGIWKVDVIAHSMGGLGVNGYIKSMGIDSNGNPYIYQGDIRHFVSLSSPFYGTYLANIIDDTNEEGLLEEHDECMEFINEEDLNGGSEATKDLQIGSDFTWELHKSELQTNVDYLTISGRRSFKRAILPFSRPYGYCLSNDYETDDGLVTLSNSQYTDRGVPLLLLDQFHTKLCKGVLCFEDGIHQETRIAQIYELFLDSGLVKTRIDNILNTGGFTPPHSGEIFYDPRSLSDPSDPLPTEIFGSSLVVIEVNTAEIPIDEDSIKLVRDSRSYNLEMNQDSGRYFYVDVEERKDVKLDFTTRLNSGSYDIYVNGIDSRKNIGLSSGDVFFRTIDYDGDFDNFDSKYIGGTDCDDNDFKEFPGQEWYPDIDNDGFRENVITETCERPESYKIFSEFISTEIDCNDDDDAVNPHAIELCNSIDDDCNIIVDNGFDVNNICFKGVGECVVQGVKICSEDQLGTICNAIPLSPSEEICGDRLDNNCNGEIDDEELCFTDLTINSPVNFEVYDSRRVLIDVSFNQQVDEILYLDSADKRQRKRRLCRNCDSYSRSKSLSTGRHELTFYGIVDDEIIATNSSFFYIDTKKPRLLKFLPRRGLTNGSYYFEATDDNIHGAGITFGNDIYGYETIEVDSCGELPRNKFYCEGTMNLSKFHNSEIDYSVVLVDVARNFVNSKNKTLLVDVNPPTLSRIQLTQSKRRVEFRLSISEENFDEVTYIDHNDRRPRERRLCGKVFAGDCLARKSFRAGDHNLTLTIKDDAGNSFVLENNLFTI